MQLREDAFDITDDEKKWKYKKDVENILLTLGWIWQMTA
jgi:hypothetical protein